MSLFLQLLVYGLTNGAVIALSALGFTLTYAVARQINLAHGSVFTLTTMAIAALAARFGLTSQSPAAARTVAVLALVGGAALVGGLLNLAVERLAFRPFRSSGDRLAPLIATVALTFLLFAVAVRWPRGTALPYHQGVAVPLRALPDLLPEHVFTLSGVTVTSKDIAVLALAALLAAGVTALLGRTRLGRALRAVAEDRETAALMGVAEGRVQPTAFALAGVVLGVAAALFALYYGGASPHYGLRAGLIVMTAAVLGGLGDPRGALAGGVLIGVLSAFSDYLFDAAWTPVLVLLSLVLLLTWRPTGLLGSALYTATDNREPAAAPLSWPIGRPTRPALLLLIGGAAFPLLDALLGWQRLDSASTALLLGTLAVGLWLVVGCAGLLDLGYAAFFALGGYTAAIVTSSGSVLAGVLPSPLANAWLALPLAAVATAGMGLLFGLPSVRARGEYLAVITLALGDIVPSVLQRLPALTGGPRGLTGIAPLRWGWRWPDSSLHVYALALLFAAGGLVMARRLAVGRIGRAWAALRDDELAAEANGVPAARLKLLAFALGAVAAGVAGAVYAAFIGHIEPEQFDLTLSLLALAAVVIGGRWGVGGVAAAALALAFIDRALLGLLSDGLRALGRLTDIEALASVNLQTDNAALFGLLLYGGTLLRARLPAAPAGQPYRRRWGRVPADQATP